MEQNNKKENGAQEVKEKVNVRHTITAEETFTLAKDVFDIRCFIKNVYHNRAVISRRLNIVALSIGFIFTLLYAAYVLFVSFSQRLGLGREIFLIVLFGVYFVLLVTLFIIFMCGSRSNTKSVFKLKRALKVFKVLLRLSSLAISITAIVYAIQSEALDYSVAVDIVIIVFSIIMIILQLVPLLCGGTARLARWLISPVKIKHRFSSVVLEWYELLVSGNAEGGAVKKVSKRYFEDIGGVIDNYLIPVLGKKYITSIKPSNLINAANGAGESDRPVVEGVLKNVFAYATECGYVIFDTCRDLNFEGSVEEEEKPPKKTLKMRLLNYGLKKGKNMLEKFITEGEEQQK